MEGSVSCSKRASSPTFVLVRVGFFLSLCVFLVSGPERLELRRMVALVGPIANLCRFLPFLQPLIKCVVSHGHANKHTCSEL